MVCRYLQLLRDWHSRKANPYAGSGRREFGGNCLGEVTDAYDASFKKVIQVRMTVKGDTNIKEVIVFEPAAPLLRIGEMRLIFIRKRPPSGKYFGGSSVPAALPGWTRPIKDGVVGPMEIAGEEEYQELEPLISKIRSIMRRAE